MTLGNFKTTWTKIFDDFSPSIIHIHTPKPGIQGHNQISWSHPSLHSHPNPAPQAGSYGQCFTPGYLLHTFVYAVSPNRYFVYTVFVTLGLRLCMIRWMYINNQSSSLSSFSLLSVYFVFYCGCFGKNSLGWKKPCGPGHHVCDSFSVSTEHSLPLPPLLNPWFIGQAPWKMVIYSLIHSFVRQRFKG